MKLDPALVRAARRSAGESARAIREANPQGAVSARPPYWAGCERMNFGELRAFIDGSLSELALAWQGRASDARPATEEEFLNLLWLLRRKAEEGPALPPAPPSPGSKPGKGRFKPSEELLWATAEVYEPLYNASRRRRRMA